VGPVQENRNSALGLSHQGVAADQGFCDLDPVYRANRVQIALFLTFLFRYKLKPEHMARITIRDLGYSPGQLSPGPKNSILDVKGKQKIPRSTSTLLKLQQGSESAK
jgi:hypothetical protein